MKSIHIENMTHAVIQHLGLPMSKVDLVREAIQSEWTGRIAFTWSRADVARVCQFNGWAYPSADECDGVLTSLMADATSKGIAEADVLAEIKEQRLDRPEEPDESEEADAPSAPVKPGRRKVKPKAKRKPAKARK